VKDINKDLPDGFLKGDLEIVLEHKISKDNKFIKDIKKSSMIKIAYAKNY